MSKPWGRIGAWPAHADRAESEEREAQPAASASSQPESKKRKMSLSEFTMVTLTAPGAGGRLTESQGLTLQHRAVHRPETEEEKMLKEEFDVLRKKLEEGLSLNANKESVQESAGEMQNLHDRINKKEHGLETLILDLDDKVRFGKKATERPGSGAGRAAVFPERPDSNGSEDYDDPWKPLNPHEPGNLKIKPFRKVKSFKKNYSRLESLATLFPMARLNGPVSEEFTQIWEGQKHVFEAQKESRSVVLYEKLRSSLISEGYKSCDSLSDEEDDNIDNGFEDEPEFPDSRSSLEDLCHSHLDTLLASIVETEKQKKKMATGVFTWKQNVEHSLEEQDKHPPFDIHEYGQAILEELSSDADRGGLMPFSDVVEGQEMYNVARSFSALLQLVTNGDVELVVDGELVCYTNMNPFNIRFVHHKKPLSLVQ